MTDMNASTLSHSAALCPAAVFFWTTIAWSPATPNSHGTTDEFSTGSHAHHPPNDSVT